MGVAVLPIVEAWLTGGSPMPTPTRRLATIVFLDVAIYEQLRGERGKRTRVGLTARSRRSLTRLHDA